MLEATMQTNADGEGSSASWRIDGEASLQANGVTSAFFTFETAVGRGRGHVRLRDGKCFTLLTALCELKGFEEKAGDGFNSLGGNIGCNPNRGVSDSKPNKRQGFVDGMSAEEEFESKPSSEKVASAKLEADRAELGYSRQPYVVIVGAGHSGVSLAARLRALDVPTIVLERGRPGDSWRFRYSTLHLHTKSSIDAFPYVDYPPEWPTYPSKDEMADWIEAYVQRLRLTVWTDSLVESSAFDSVSKEWTVRVAQPGGKIVILRPKHLVLATGLFGDVRIPTLEGAETFLGAQYHSSEHRSNKSDVRGLKCVVIGAATSGHDVSQDLCARGADVTLVQRSPTLVLRARTLADVYFKPLLSLGLSQIQVDLTIASTPYRLLTSFQAHVVAAANKVDADLHEGLRAAGFRLNFPADGIIGLGHRRAAGYYYDKGASRLIADGRVALRHGTVAQIRPRSVLLADGGELPADVIVYATGSGPVTEAVARLTSPEVAAKVGPVWGYGSGFDGDQGPWEGELRNVWKPTAQEGLWIMTGALSQTRFASLILALQLKARAVGLPTLVYSVAGPVNPGV